MAKNKANKVRKLPKQIRFEIEKNAEQLMLEAEEMLEFADKFNEDEEEVAATKSKKRQRHKQNFYQIDLHGLTLAESKQRLDNFFLRILDGKQRIRVKIITGKGRHTHDSTNLLARDVHVYVAQKYAERIVEIEQSPFEVQVGGLPIRGHFEVVLL